MPSKLDFDSTRNSKNFPDSPSKAFRDFLINKTLKVHNGPQTFTASDYQYQKLSDFSDVDSGGVDIMVDSELKTTSTTNVFKPEQYFIKDTLEVLPRRANLSLYPYFVAGDYTLYSIVNSNSFTTESELFKFAANYIKSSTDGPILTRIAQYSQQNSLGTGGLSDLFGSNNPSATNILSGKEPFVETDFSITVDNSISITPNTPSTDIVELSQSNYYYPYSIIPGNYLTDPQNIDLNPRPSGSTQVQAFWQDATGAIGSLFGIQRRPTNSRRPSDLLVKYMGQGQKNRLFDLLRYSKYAPNYTTTAMSQNTSNVFRFADSVAQGVKTALGSEAPQGQSYIGDDRNNDVYFAMNDFYDRPVRSSYYLSLMFDPVAADLFHDAKTNKNISEGGPIAGQLTWVSPNSKTKPGTNNSYSTDEISKFKDTLSIQYGFKQDSILGITQEILNSMPSNAGTAKSHVANVIDQTSRVFADGDVMISRGNAVKYVSKFNNKETGIEYGRVWTKDRSYYALGDTMPLNDDEPTSKYYKKTNKPYRRSNIRRFGGSVLDNTWNLNIYPVSNGKNAFDGSTNIVEHNQGQGDFYAKKFMFSIENLAWKTSNKAGFTVNDLPYSERGPNGGRIMWFPPYDLKINEQNSATWEDNKFLGRPEPVYTYSFTQRSATVSFKVVVDHPSILNLLVKEHFKNLKDEEADNYINAYFAGIKDVDFYSMIQTYAMLNKNDLDLIQAYLNGGAPTQVIEQNAKTSPQPTQENKSNSTNNLSIDSNVYNLYFDNAIPINTGNIYSTNDTYTNDFNAYSSNFPQILTNMGELIQNAVNAVNAGTANANVLADVQLIFGKTNGITSDDVNFKTTNISSTIFDKSKSDFTSYTNNIGQLKTKLANNEIQNIHIVIQTSASSPDNSKNNLQLSVRRAVSIINDIVNQLKSPTSNYNFSLPSTFSTQVNSVITQNKTPQFKLGDINDIVIPIKDLGYNNPSSDVNPKITFSIASEGELTQSPDCTTPYNDVNLQIYGPNAIKCRHGLVNIEVSGITNPSTNNTLGNNTNNSNIAANVSNNTVANSGSTVKPSIDVMKRIIMETLSEAYYFKKLEETSPITFKSLREKLKYFHPGFHSMTPEGLNARLTFLLQCVRPGDTIPIKGISDPRDEPARNTTFGPPPICVLRIGDFYNTKVIVRDVNITYDDSTWDLNPDGIGMQPMLANVTMQISLIGGSGLEAPVDKLQNALSSNFFANTEMYDERSQSTATDIGGKPASGFTKQFLESLQSSKGISKTSNYNKTPSSPAQGKTIGSLTNSNQSLDYTSLINEVYTNTSNYYDAFTNAVNTVLPKFGPVISYLYFNPIYRPINNYTVYTDTGTATISLFGEPDPTNTNFSFVDAISGFKAALETSIRTIGPSLIFDYYNVLGNAASYADGLMINTMVDLVNKVVDTINQTVNTSLSSVISSRNKLILTLDKLNYPQQNFLFSLNGGTTQDGSIVNLSQNKFSQIQITGFTSSDYINAYYPPLKYIGARLSFADLNLFSDYALDFTNPVIADNLDQILPYLISGIDENTMFSDFYRQNTISNDVVSQMKTAYNNYKSYTSQEQKVNFPANATPKNTSQSTFVYGIAQTNDLTDTNLQSQLKSIFSDTNQLGTTLNLFNHT